MENLKLTYKGHDTQILKTGITYEARVGVDEDGIIVQISGFEANYPRVSQFFKEWQISQDEGITL